MNVLALDPAIKSGWAMVVNGHYTSGTIDCTKSRAISAGDAYAELYRRLGCMTPIIKDIQAIVIETPTPRSMKSAAIQYGMYAIPQMVAADYRIGYTVVFPNEVKKFLNEWMNGKESQGVVTTDLLEMMTKVPENKQQSVIYFYHNVGHLPTDDNEADAFALLRYYMHKMDCQLSSNP